MTDSSRLLNKYKSEGVIAGINGSVSAEKYSRQRMIPLPAFYAFIFLRKFLFQNVAVKEEKQGRLTPAFLCMTRSVKGIIS